MREQRSHPLTRIREQHNLTQDRLAEVARISARTIMRAEQNRPIGAESRRLLCEYFGMTAEELGLQLPSSPDFLKEESHTDIPPLPRTPDPLAPPLRHDGPQGTGNDAINRRQLLQFMGGIGLTLFTTPPLAGIAQEGNGLHDEEMLSLCTVYIPICWRLYFDGHLVEVQNLLSSILSPLAVLVRQLSPYQAKAAVVASKAHQLACMLALQHQDYGMALIHVDQAVQCAQIAEDDHLQVTSLIRKALVYRYLKHPTEMLRAYEEAIHYHKGISPLLQGRLYTGLAEAYSTFSRESDALYALERAYKVFPEHPTDDPNFSYTHFKLPKGFEVVMYLNLKQPKKAWQALTQADTSISKAIVPDRVELSLDQAKAALLLGEKEQSCSFLSLAATSAKILGSTLRYNEAYGIYQQMVVMWPRERQVKALVDHFQ